MSAHSTRHDHHSLEMRLVCISLLFYFMSFQIWKANNGSQKKILTCVQALLLSFLQLSVLHWLYVILILLFLFSFSLTLCITLYYWKSWYSLILYVYLSCRSLSLSLSLIRWRSWLYMPLARIACIMKWEYLLFPFQPKKKSFQPLLLWNRIYTQRYKYICTLWYIQLHEWERERIMHIRVSLQCQIEKRYQNESSLFIANVPKMSQFPVKAIYTRD